MDVRSSHYKRRTFFYNIGTWLILLQAVVVGHDFDMVDTPLPPSNDMVDTGCILVYFQFCNRRIHFIVLFESPAQV